MATNTALIPVKDDALRAARPDWPFSAWSTGDMIRRGVLGCIRIGRRVFVTSELLDTFVQQHRVDPIQKRVEQVNEIHERFVADVKEGA